MNSFEKIANPKTGRLVIVTKKKGQGVLQKYINSSQDPNFSNICNPSTGLWMDVRGDAGKEIIDKYLSYVKSKSETK